MAPQQKRARKPEYDVDDFKPSASRFGEYEERALNMNIEETGDILRVFPKFTESPVHPDLEHLKLEEFDYDKILTFVPTKHMELDNNQRRFLIKLRNVLMNNAYDSPESRLELHIQAMVDVFLQQCELDDALELEIVPSKLTMLIADKKFSTFSDRGDREGRKNDRLVWVLQASKHKNDTRYKSGDVQLASALIAACQWNYNDTGCNIVPRIMYGINVKGDEVSILSARFTSGYITSLFGGLPTQKLKILRYPEGTGLRLSHPLERAKVLCLMAELRKYALSIDTSMLRGD